jgi:Cysteine-rich CWC
MPASTPEALDDCCPRCGAGFRCGAAEGVCDCFGLQLDAPLRAELARQWPGQCLCLRCLRALAQAPSPLTISPPDEP